MTDKGNRKHDNATAGAAAWVELFVALAALGSAVLSWFADDEQKAFVCQACGLLDLIK